MQPDGNVTLKFNSLIFYILFERKDNMKKLLSNRLVFHLVYRILRLIDGCHIGGYHYDIDEYCGIKIVCICGDDWFPIGEFVFDGGDIVYNAGWVEIGRMA
jgi:hypothetical protein